MSPSAPDLTLLFTGDLHGRAGATDPFTGRPFAGGMGRVATLLAEARRRDPDAIYLDLGDLVQGTPMSYLHAVERPDEVHPMVRLLNDAGCEGMVVGNHDFNFGMRWLATLRRTADFPVLGANVLGPDGRPFFEPVLRLERRGRRVAVLGVTTPQVPRWEEPWNYEGLTFRSAVDTVLEWMPRLRAEADAVVVAAHMGWEGVTDGGLEVPRPLENAVREMLEATGEPDVVLMAHTHRIARLRGAKGTLAVQAGWGGQALGEVTLSWNERGAALIGDRPRAECRIERTGLEIAADPAVEAVVGAAERRAAERMREVIGTAAAPFSAAGARYGDTAVLSLVHRAQLWASGARLSSTAPFREHEDLGAGPVRRLDLFRIYPYENDLTILELAVDDLRAYLEEVARSYEGPAVNGAPPPIDARVGSCNHDSVAGCEYEIDPGLPAGRRLTRLTFGGEEWPGDRRVRMAVSSYRAQGGGGYASLRRARVVERTRREIRGILADYVRERGVIRPELFDNWRVVGADGAHGG
jgi:2',3'-cyclic-nucleotide 2'-phosphodiesterase/3'-nucleotidase